MSARANGLQSMTGYGRATTRTLVGTITVELRGTNHRYLEVDQRLPNGWSTLQERVGQLIRAGVRRGRVEAVIAMHDDRVERRRVTFDEPLLARYHQALMELRGRFGLKGPVTLEHLLALPQAVSIVEEKPPAEQLWGVVERTATEALHDFIRARRREGAKLVADLRRQAQAIDRHVRAIKRRLPKAMEEQRRRLREQLTTLLGPGATGSAAQLRQAASLVQEADIHEELVRLESHLAYVRQMLAGAQLIGKRLDFIGQELMREANTMGAKVNDPQAAQHVVEVKSCIEKIREQAQNLE